MSDIIVMIVFFVLIAILLLYFLWPKEKNKAKEMSVPMKYRWQDEIIPSDLPWWLKLLKSWQLMIVAIPTSSWMLLLVAYQLGWFSDGHRVVKNYFWLPLIFFSVVMLVGSISFSIIEKNSGKTIRGIPFWKQCLMFKEFSFIWKPLMALSLAGFIASMLALGWVFIGGVIYFALEL